MNFSSLVASYANGAKIWAEMFGDGHPVPKFQAQARADVCLKCPLNDNFSQTVEHIADAIRKTLEFKNHLQLRVDGEKSLHTCMACKCPLRSKIWMPIELIAPDDEEKQSLPKHCWLLKESPE